MPGVPTWELWGVIAGLAVGTFLIRISFLGLVGRRKLPPAVLRHLRYTGVAVLPGLVAPLALWPAATGGAPDLPRLLAALCCLAAGLWTRSVLGAMAGGAAALYLGLGLQAAL
jgi:branched-subunit amino acid transport protein